MGLMLLGFPEAALAGSGGASDPDDVPLRLDLKAVTHTNDESSITYTAETYEDFPDELTAFKWGIDKDGDQDFELVVFTEWEGGRLTAGVDDPDEEPVAKATVSRPAANAVAVSFATGVLGGVSSYHYGVSSEDDVNGNGETEAGEQDVAPDTGLYRHELASSPSAATLSAGSSAPVPPAGPRLASPAPIREREASPAPTSVSAVPQPRAVETGVRAPKVLAGVLLICGGLMLKVASSRPLVALRRH